MAELPHEMIVWLVSPLVGKTEKMMFSKTGGWSFEEVERPEDTDEGAWVVESLRLGMEFMNAFTAANKDAEKRTTFYSFDRDRSIAVDVINRIGQENIKIEKMMPYNLLRIVS